MRPALTNRRQQLKRPVSSRTLTVLFFIATTF
jgi:hypothetical protein